jgi:hypothetical protein
MSDSKKKAAAIAAVKTVIEINNNNVYSVKQPTEPTAWSQWGKQTTMVNRNLAQRRLNKR